MKLILPYQSLLRSSLLAVLSAAALLTAGQTQAGTPSGKAPEPIVEPEAPFITGSLSLMVDTHFVSYGQDVWAAGQSWQDPLFHPSIELNFNLGGGFSFILGSWWDVNDNAVSDIGNRIQEVDVWAGISYAAGDWKFTLLYQDWMYSESTEQIVDFKISYTHFLNPYFLIHSRPDGGEFLESVGFDDGIVAQVGIAPGCSMGPVSLSFPVAVSYDTKNFHGGQAGLGFASAGVTASIPLTKAITASIGATYYYTNDLVIPGNPDEGFVMGSAGITVVF
ncbi:hypothetical protein EI77_03328 [Prosthecobacter fusiformis]|uniref:Outer membrane beta-barrel porin/alpha-amylase n=1 Tax=Prosthecobacter fusiformis TaxID=48464 RepID=A0A4R7RRM0_9BACT|nr:hypothetical protein [Prosthecobacter fusiformis]TDU68211.1 hypothetical protein EI77_03328 [Prosthecobacter fusiformis]